MKAFLVTSKLTLLLQLLWHSASIPAPVTALGLIKVRYGYFPEARPIHAACARGFFDFYDAPTETTYMVACYPQTSGGYAASRLDNSQLHIANLGSTPAAMAIARGIDIQVLYVSHYMGESQGIYVRPSNPPYKAIQTPFDLEGRTIAVPFGSTMHYQVLFLVDLFGLAGSVKLLDLSPTQIIEAWNANEIDAGACWGLARDHLLTNGKAETLLTAADLANWGRPTFVVVAATRQFASKHTNFINHFVAILSRLNDSFIDRLGGSDIQNVLRWEGQQTLAGSSYMPSLVDALMFPQETPRNPSRSSLIKQRNFLELFHQLPAGLQLSCNYLGPMPGACTKPTLVHETLKDTANFLLGQKVIATLGRLEQLSDDANGCQQNPNSSSVTPFCASDIVDGSFLAAAQRVCSNCYPVGLYAAGGSTTGNDNLLSELERLDAQSLKSRSLRLRKVRLDGGPKATQRLPGKSYSDNLNCWWEIRAVDCNDPDQQACNRLVDIELTSLRLWSGDFIRIYSDPIFKRCQPDSTSNVLVAQLSGFQERSSLPNFRGRGCLLFQFQTDGNAEKSYGDNLGDGFTAIFDRSASPCRDASHCNGNACLDGMCSCPGTLFGAACTHDRYCLGTTQKALKPGEVFTIRSSLSSTLASIQSADPNGIVKPTEAYRNDLDCSWDLSVPPGHVVKATVSHDLELHDFLYLQTGALSYGQGRSPQSYTVLTGTNKGDSADYYLPSDANGYASLHFKTDSRGRRRGFYAKLQAIDPSGVQPEGTPCPIPGYSGRNCEVPHCVANNDFQSPKQSSDIVASHVLGRVVSQADGMPVRAAPWAPDGGCLWNIQDIPTEEVVAIRFVFNSPLDLEPRPAFATGDSLVLKTSTGKETMFFMESCERNDTCSFPWQTGSCTRGGCEVQEAVEAKVDKSSTIRFVTDRNDGGLEYRYAGLDFDALLVEECPTQAGMKHCEAANSNGRCFHGLCYCAGGVPCACPCEGEPPSTVAAKVGLTVGIVVPLFMMLVGGFLFYRRRKILASREQKRIIAEKEAELEAFRDSIVGMRVAVREYVPVPMKTKKGRALSKTKSLRLSVTKEPPKIVWCWEETTHLMGSHTPSRIFGDPKDCWIRYDKKCSAMLEDAYQNKSGGCRPLKGYFVDTNAMIQTKEATGFQRKVQRVVCRKSVEGTKDLDLSEANFSDGMPTELAGEPQVVLVKDDLIQISKRHGDWAFGTKLYHADEAVARELVKLACKDAPSTDDANILADTGWFQEDATAVPTGDQLTALQAKVGDTNALDAPSHWIPVTDPTVAERHPLSVGDTERDVVVSAFLKSLKPPQFKKKVRVSTVERVQNLAMWQSFVVKRQTICWRETEMLDDGSSKDVQKRALERIERRWLWHGTNAEVMDKIMQQGFNRSFCGKNATMHGKGVYFARDASYSASEVYAVPDKHGYQYMLACRVVVGEYCKGVMDALTPSVRDSATNILYDCTVGLLPNDTMANPSIYVTYHDAQAYPEYLIRFRSH
ncbi:polymerase 14 [Seminavis robusta]|uniref:Poly [ADP-ribose] polymerase n=1 Tax=Seminavis robusta TaxID=568900 RepID=A0A9N8DD97_9STRA|nr:polymerase 14 [Seminavis robusta]|eukprot:Sro41_g025300.1 polymerase 14 (1501) ;mRNA; f:111987-117236